MWRRLIRARSPDDLWRNGDFVRLWSSLTITHFGGQITFLALPLIAVLTLHATPFQMGMLIALEALPFPLFGLLTGVVVDRAPKLPIIVGSDIARGVALLAVPMCAWLGVLSIGVLYAVGFLVGLGTVLGWPAYQVFMTERVGRGKLVEANAKIGVSDSAAQLIGPGLAGGLIQWLTAPFAILLDAISFFLSAWILRGIRSRPSDAPKMRASRFGAEIREGLAAIWRDPTLRALAWALSIWQVFRHAFLAIVVLFAARDLGFSAGHLGALWMLAGVGSLGATSVIEWLNQRFGFGRAMLAGILGTGLGWLLISVAQGGGVAASALFGLGLFVLDFSAMVFFINYLALRHAVTPDPLLGRVTATMISLTVASAPLGGLAGGWIAEVAGPRTTMVLAGLGAILLAPLMAWTSPLSALRTLPGEQEPRLTERVADELAG
ncbi:MAG: MFS transporter [Burkholderiales bacterium]